MKNIYNELLNGKAGLKQADKHFVDHLKNSKIHNQAFIGGQFVDSKSGNTYDNISPINGKIINQVAFCGKADVDQAVSVARTAFVQGKWSRAAKSERKRVLLNFARLIEQSTDELAALEAIDVGKPFEMARDIDIWSTVDAFQWYAELCDKLEDRIAPTDDLDILSREPIGVIGAVLPWNYPAMILSWKVAPILAAGNSVVIKPAEQSPLSALRIAELAKESGIPDGVFNVVPGDGPSTGALVGLHEDIDAVGFTGSTQVGKKFLEYSGLSNMKSISLECGGKSPMIVFKDADAAEAAKAIASAVFYNSGQSCNAPTRAIIHESILRDFVSELVSQVADYMPNNPFTSGTPVGAVISDDQLARMHEIVTEAIAKGATIESGGEIILSETGGYYYSPTIVSNTSQKMRINIDEIFGPIIPIQSFSEIDEAIQIANDTKYGLWANVWTNQLDVALKCGKDIKAGTVAMNCVWGGSTATPMGGYKESGLGRERGIDGLLKFTQLKHISLLPPS